MGGTTHAGGVRASINAPVFAIGYRSTTSASARDAKSSRAFTAFYGDIYISEAAKYQGSLFKRSKQERMKLGKEKKAAEMARVIGSV